MAKKPRKNKKKKLTPFGEYLRNNKIETIQASSDLGLDQGFISHLCYGGRGPSLAVAARIVKWSGGALDFWFLLPPYKKPRGL